jgi:type IV pilus assembly protein PilC
VVKGQIEATSETAAADALWNDQLLVTSLTQSVVPQAIRRKSRRKPSAQDVMGFTRQLATMLRAGLPLVQAMSALARQTNNAKLGVVLQQIVTALEEGEAFGDSLTKHPRLFDRLYISMVRAGEASGTLPEILYEIAKYQEANLKLRSKVKSAMSYPTVVCAVGVAISLFLIVKIIPAFADIYKQFNSELPAPTMMLIMVSNTIRHNLIYCLSVCTLISFLFIRFKRSKRGAFYWDMKKLRLPIVGPLALKIALSRFARTLSTLVRSGVPILNALRTVNTCTGNRFMEAALEQTATDIEHGNTLAVSLGRHSIFPPMVLEMVSAGEQTGSVDGMLEQAATHFEEEIDATLNGLTALIEPILIVILGLVVGTVVVCMFLPIFQISQVIKF